MSKTESRADAAPDSGTPTTEPTDVQEQDAAAVATDGSGIDDGRSWWLQRPEVSRVTGIVVFVLGVVGFVASTTLTIERIQILINPSYVPSCSINPVLSCGSVMVTAQARLFGFPNPLIGIAAFSVIIVTGVLTTTRVTLPRWYWLGQTICLALGFVFVNWLAFQSLYRINALCPYCMAVWALTPILLILSVGRLMGDSDRAHEIRGWLWVLLPLWYAIVIVAIGIRFWDYWSTLI
ncbi:vitamin K epoxide reductase family protein [Gordonia sp. DT219]|uniref:vitamin K epoxide reductase family protein n=1 Tax=Gordonia sp. DT219 TaxID=3416658 RepID=UPI003CF656A3